jgi:hypothetical protein
MPRRRPFLMRLASMLGGVITRATCRRTYRRKPRRAAFHPAAAFATHGFVNRPGEPGVPISGRRQKHRHGLRVNRAQHLVCFGCQKREEFVPARLFLPLAGPKAPDAGEGKKRPALVESKPVSHLGPAVAPFAKGRCRNEAAPFRLEPSAPKGRRHIVVTGTVPRFGGGGNPQRIIVSSRSPSRATQTTSAIESG